jgi:hypothetical protein
MRCFLPLLSNAGSRQVDRRDDKRYAATQGAVSSKGFNEVNPRDAADTSGTPSCGVKPSHSVAEGLFWAAST